MKKIKNDFFSWVKNHKKELIAIGISIPSIIAVILICRNTDSIIEYWNTLKNSVFKGPINKTLTLNAASQINDLSPNIVEAVEGLPVHSINFSTDITKRSFEVSPHVRNLHNGWHASAEKIASSAEHGYDLLPGQTWVEKYLKGRDAI